MPEFKTEFATEIEVPAEVTMTATDLRAAQEEEWGQYVAATHVYAPSGALAFAPGHAVPASSVSDTGPVLPSQVVRRTPAVERQVAAVRAAEGGLPQPDADAQPAGNATAEEWRAYAVRQGMDESQAAGLGRDELRAQYVG